jgi:hypothetical protein
MRPAPQETDTLVPRHDAETQSLANIMRAVL